MVRILVVFTLVLACAASDLPPAVPDASSTCAACRMMLSDLRFAGQLVAAGEDPRFFDDIGCMRKYRAERAAGKEWRGYVSDYRTKRWLAADEARLWKCGSIDTPMSSHIVATAPGAEKPAGDCVALTDTTQ